MLEPVYEKSYISDSYACLRGRGSLAAVQRYEEFVRRLGGTGYVLTCDIRHLLAFVEREWIL